MSLAKEEKIHKLKEIERQRERERSRVLKTNETAMNVSLVYATEKASQELDLCSLGMCINYVNTHASWCVFRTNYCSLQLQPATIQCARLRI